MGIFGKVSHTHVTADRIPAILNSPSRSRNPDAANPNAVTNDQKNVIMRHPGWAG
jgi:hypothetical protein